MQPGTAQPESSENDTPKNIQISVDVAPGEIIHITITGHGSGNLPETSISRSFPQPQDASKPKPPRFLSKIKRVRLVIGSKVLTLDEVLFSLVILVYLSTRLIGLTQFPIYFFTDEAIQTVQAADFVRDDFQNSDKEFLPTYFVNGNQYNLSLSVYLQVLPYILFGKSEPVTRGTAVLATVIGAICIGLIFRDIFKIKYWWLATLILSITPAWFLHSRTAFETALMVSMYIGFLYYYLKYRYINPGSLYAALVFAALTFYAYSPGQVVMAVTGVLLLISDIRYHWQNRKTGLIGLGVLALLAMPYIRFLVMHGAENYSHLQILGSYLTEPIPLSEKLSRYLSHYLQGLSPAYWYLPNPDDLGRHLMKGYGNLLRFTIPFAVLGFGICVKNIRSSKHRLILIAILAAPSGAALVGIGITRLLVFVVPAAMITSLGVWACLDWLEKHRLDPKVLALGLFIPLVAFNIYMLNDALTNGPVWYPDYGLGGMQYGARQVFRAAQDYLEQNPATHILLTSTWANGTDVVARFFLPDSSPIELGSIAGYLVEHKPLDRETLFIMTPQEFAAVNESGKFTNIQVEKTLPYPDGSPGFYFIRLNYVDNIDQVLADEKEARSELQTGEVAINDETVGVSYSMLDMGEIQNAFDHNDSTVIRSLEANPLVIDLTFPHATTIQGLIVKVGGVATAVRAFLHVEDSAAQRSFSIEVPETPLPKDAFLDFNEALAVERIHLEIESIQDGEPAHVHVWEITIK